eukprot:5058230-Alexandrium_andersonii.AAC.1
MWVRWPRPILISWASGCARSTTPCPLACSRPTSTYDMPALADIQRARLFAEAELIAQADKVERGLPAP